MHMPNGRFSTDNILTLCRRGCCQRRRRFSSTVTSLRWKRVGLGDFENSVLTKHCCIHRNPQPIVLHVNENEINPQGNPAQWSWELEGTVVFIDLVESHQYKDHKSDVQTAPIRKPAENLANEGRKQTKVCCIPDVENTSIQLRFTRAHRPWKLY
jgi:hypothetical protein